jgi:uncharacterized repeat protein (TIGR03843 family)
MKFNRPVEQVLTVLSKGEIQVAGRFLWGSNYTFLVEVHHESIILPAVYKPSQGERPLWDFPYGSLGGREIAAFLTSKALGWNLVPPTVFRADGPAGEGSLQVFVDTDPEMHYFEFSEAQKELLRPTAAFDLLINNADRKGGHILIDPEGEIFLIDHGLCFHREPKLRTVIWDFVDEPIPDHLKKDIKQFIDPLEKDTAGNLDLRNCLSSHEIEALVSRGRRMLEEECFPKPGTGRPYPWPLI